MTVNWWLIALAVILLLSAFIHHEAANAPEDRDYDEIPEN